MLPTHTELIELLAGYFRRFPAEKESVEKFSNFVNRNLETSVYSRNNFDGHFTASAFLVDKTKTKALFLKHKKLNRWLQPGGHIDETDASILEAALREVSEETGLQRADLRLIDDLIFDLDAHEIPENAKKNEPAHVHYDVRYLVEVVNHASIYVNAEEAEGLTWFSGKEVQALVGFERIVKKMRMN